MKSVVESRLCHAGFKNGKMLSATGLNRFLYYVRNQIDQVFSHFLLGNHAGSADRHNTTRFVPLLYSKERSLLRSFLIYHAQRSYMRRFV